MKDDILTSLAEVDPSAFVRATLAQVKARPGFYDCPHGRALGFCPFGCDVQHVEHGFELFPNVNTTNRDALRREAHAVNPLLKDNET